MAYPTYGSVPGSFGDTDITTFTNANGTNPLVLTDVPAAASGNLLGGKRVYDMIATSTDTVANVLNIYEGVQVSLYANMGTVTISGTNAINRSVGSFITDGWQVGDTAMLLGSATSGNNNKLVTVATVVAGVLTFSGTPFTNDTEAAGFRVIRMAMREGVGIPALSGVATSQSAAPASSVQIINANDSSKDSSGIELGPNSLLIGAMYAAPASTKVVTVFTKHAKR